MGFLGVYHAIYDYAPQARNELSIQEGDLLFVLEKSTEDDWWRAKKKARDGEDEEPEGLIPSTYIEEAQELHYAKALYEYSRQTDEEISFPDGAVLQVFDETDPDWTLVGYEGEYGFAPANYIEKAGAVPSLPARSHLVANDYAAEPSPDLSPAQSPMQSPAAALAGLIQQKTGQGSSASRSRAIQYTPEASDEEQAPPSLPQRPGMSPNPQYDKALPPEPPEVMASPARPRSHRNDYDDEMPMTAGGTGFHNYHIHEMISHNGKNKKMPTALGLNLIRGIIMIAPEKAKNGSAEEWTAEKLTNYSIEGKHVFMELVRPSKSIDFHAGSKDTANEIVAALGELAGAARAEGLREVMAAGAGSGGGQKKGKMLYEFMAQGDDEVTVAVGDEVVVLDDSASEEWWKVRRLKNGKEGVVPSSYVEVTGARAAAISSDGGYSGGRDQNRRDEERFAREALQNSQASEYRRDSRRESQSAPSKSTGRTRRWTDRTGSFKVDAEFLGLKDGKIHLHKTNGVKIAVPVNKMSLEDLEFVEQATGQNLDDEKPLSAIRRNKTQIQERPRDALISITSSRAGAAIQPQEPSYDWFDFFLSCGVNPQICERYASAFNRDQMGEENLQDIDASLLRSLGIKEGDILRVMKTLDNKFGRTRDRTAASDDVGGLESSDGAGLFSGPGGALRNNTRKGRPAPVVQTSDTVDPRAFEQNNIRNLQPVDRPQPAAVGRTMSGFDDDAWDVKPSQQQAPASASVQRPAPTGAMSELSLLSPPLQPIPAPATQQAAQLQPPATGADPSFFDQLARPSTAQPNQAAAARQRPQPSQHFQNQSSMLQAPPQRPISAPQNVNAYLPPALKPEITGYQTQIAPPTRSLNDLNQQRFQQQVFQQQQQLYSQPTGFNGFVQPNNLLPQQTGFNGYMQPQPTGLNGYMQPQQTGYNTQQQLLNGQQTGSPFADPMSRPPFQPQPTALQPQQTGFALAFPAPQYQPLQPQQTGYMPPLQPQQTGYVTNGYAPPQSLLSSQPTGFGQRPSQLPQQQTGYQPMAAPLQPQKTGPAPPVRFGMQSAQKLTPQMTGRRADLSKASAANPFGF